MERQRAKRVGRGAFVVVAAALLFAACASPPPPVDDSTATYALPRSVRPTGPGVTLEKVTRFRKAECPFTQARLRGARRRSDLGPGIECGYLRVPENRAKPNGASIELAMGIVHSTSDHPAADPIIYLSGGPGGSGLATVNSWTFPPSPLIADRDLILLDQRGTGYSTPSLSCDDEARTSTGDDTDLSFIGACHDRLVKNGVDLDSYNTQESAADVNDLRQALGLAQWNLFGVSYGTRLALRVMLDHPEGVRSVILDSVYTPGVAAFDEQAPNGARAIGTLLDRCAADDACNRAYPNLKSRLYAALDRLDQSSARARVAASNGRSYSVTISGKTVVRIAFDTLYDSAALPSLPRILDLVARGNLDGALDVLIDPPSARERSSQQASDPPPSYERPSLSDGLFYSIECADEAPRTTVDSVNASAAPVDDQIRRALVPKVTDVLKACESWPVQAKDLPTTSSDIPTLVLAGGLDPITPAAWAELAAQGLSHATYRLFPDAGHGVFQAGACATSVITTFLTDPKSPPDGCQPEPIQFVTR